MLEASRGGHWHASSWPSLTSKRRAGSFPVLNARQFESLYVFDFVSSRTGNVLRGDVLKGLRHYQATTL